ncbi:MAG: hypothetical protein ACYC9L_06650 [Sulfuricaulis sp.]
MNKSRGLIFFILLCVSCLALADDTQAAMAKVDALLAGYLKDPGSATQYKTSGIIPCKQVTAFAADGDGDGDGDCMCYSVNAKNSFGGYTGAIVEVAKFVGAGAIREVGGTFARAACSTVKLVPRDPSFIVRAAEQ